MKRRELVFGAAALALRAQNKPRQSFRAGVVPSGRNSPVDAFWSGCDEVSALGFHIIEFNNTRAEIVEAYLDHVDEFREELSRRQLALAGVALFSHIANAELKIDLLDHHLKLGHFLSSIGGAYITHMIAPAEALNESMDEKDYRGVDVRVWAANANEIGRWLLNEYGVKLAYHPEQVEIRTGLHERFLAAADERYVRLLVDTGHIESGGANPVEFCRRFRDRIEAVHLKDFGFGPSAPAKAGNVPFGQGSVDLRGVVSTLLETNFSGWVMSESGGTNRGMRDYMAQSLNISL